MLICDNRYYENLPTGWSVSTLSQITSSQLLNDGDWILSENMVPNGDVKLIQLGSIGSMCYIDKGFKYLTEDTFHELSCVQIFSGYMLINRIISDKMYACILPRLDGKLITTVDTCWIAPKDKWYNLKYLMYFISSTAFQSIVLHVSSGTTRKRISKSDLIHLPICFPPLSEQQRIVTRIDELFAQVDIIEQNQADIDKLYDEFRKRTLTLAIQGKLVPQNPNDEPASVLLERIRAEKKAKLGKKYVDSYIYKGDDNCYYEHITGRAQDEPVEVPFDIPDNWEWSKIKYIADTQTGTTPSTSDKSNFGDYISFVKPGDLVNGRILYNREMLSERGLNNGRLIPSNSVIMVCIGGSTGKCALTDRDISCNQQINTASPCKWVLPQYLFFFMTSDYFYKTVRANATGTATPIINRSTWENLVIPIPPLAEQKRIVAKINEIFAMQ